MTLVAVLSLLAPFAMTRVNERDGLSYVWIPPGTYSMGCSQGDGDCFAWEPDAHQVRIDNGFWIGETEVTGAGVPACNWQELQPLQGSELPRRATDLE